MTMMTSQILKSVDFTKTQKSRYFENETFFLQIKILITHQRLLHGKNSFVAEVTFKGHLGYKTIFCNKVALNV